MNKLLNGVFAISLVALGVGLIEKFNKQEATRPAVVVQPPSLDSMMDKMLDKFPDLPLNPQSNRQDTSKYTIIFDEIEVSYRAFHLPSGARNYRVCFNAVSGGKNVNKQFPERLGQHIQGLIQSSPFSLRGIKLEGVKNTEGCKITVGFDSQMNRACTENAKEYFEMEISDFQRGVPLSRVLNNFFVEVKCRIIKQT
ncbi:MAG: hypothetical protein HWD63_10410 [Candidatus Parvibacillus calidus]|nr:MAG: hypothetical protein HWD63_10410 [Candidatus Parvibacillus calidus]